MQSHEFDGETVKTKSGENIKTRSEIGSGKEGNVYSSNVDNIVVKILNPDKRSNDMIEKLSIMIKNKPEFGEADHRFFAWPLDIVLYDSNFVGYTMPEVDTDNFDTLRTFIRKNISDSKPITPNKLKLSYNLSSVVESVHRQGHAVGDFNFKNILVKNKKITMIDCDAYSIGGEGGAEFHGDTMFDKHIPPEGRPDNSIQSVQMFDYFNLAMWIFRIMTGYLHPYQARGDLSISGNLIEMVKNNPFAFWNPKEDLIQPPKGQTLYEKLPDSLRVLFENAFLGGKYHTYKRPSARVWRNTLYELIEQDSGMKKDEQSNIKYNQALGSGNTPPSGSNNNSFSLTKEISSLEIGPTVAVSGNIISTSELREFETDDKTGFISELTVGDKSGEIRAVFWDKLGVMAARSLHPGLSVKIEGEVRKGYPDNIDKEIHVNEFQTDQYGDNYTPVISDLTDGTNDVHVRGSVICAGKLNKFDKNRSDGVVLNTIISDNSGYCRAVFWGSNARKMEHVKPGQTVEIVQGYTKNKNGNVEVHVDDEHIPPYISDLSVNTNLDTIKLNNLTQGDIIDVYGRVVSVNEITTFERNNGEQGKVKNIRVKNGKNALRIALWDGLAEYSIDEQNKIFISNIKLKTGKYEDIEGSTTPKTLVSVF